MRDADMESLPPWKGEPESDRDYLETIDAIVACYQLAMRKKRRRG